MNGLALFAGIGGLELGLKLAIPGFRSICHIERDAYAASVLVARMEDEALDDAPIWDDIVTFDAKPFAGRVSIISGGFPCTDISVAGKGAGIEGEHSGLWSEYARIIREVGPRFVFVENVPALTSRGLDRVLGDLASLGFDAEWDCFSASGSGAPMLRRRIFILAHSPNHHGGSGERREEAGVGPNGERRRGSAIGGEAVADATGPRLQRDEHEPGIPEGSAPELRSTSLLGSSGADLEERERVEGRLGSLPELRGLPLHNPQNARLGMRLPSDRGLGPLPLWPPGPGDSEGWRDYIAAGGPEPSIRRGADGLPFRVDRLRCLGNAVVAVVAARAFITLARRLSD